MAKRQTISEWLTRKSLQPLDNWGNQNQSPTAYGEDGGEVPKVPRVVNTVTGQSFNLQQLLRALRSDAPGQYTQNVWELGRQFMGMAYIAIHTLCEQAAQSQFHLFVRDKKHPKRRRHASMDDPIRELFENPNEQDTLGDFLYEIALQLCLTGQCLIWCVPRKGGTLGLHGFNYPHSMYVIPTAITQALGPSPQFPYGAYRVQPLYPYGPFGWFPSPYGIQGAIVPAEQIMRVKFKNPIFRYDGYAPLSGCRLQSDTLEAIDRARFYGQLNAPNIGTVVEFDKEVTNPTAETIGRLRAEFEGMFSGPENFWKLFIAQPGTTVRDLGTGKNPTDMAWQEGWEQLSSFILACFGVTKPVAGMVDETSYATLYAAMKQFHMVRLRPLLARIAGQLTKRIVRPYNSEMFIELEAPKIDDEQVLQGQLTTLISISGVTINEVRIAFGMEPVEWGDVRAGEAEVREAEAEAMAQQQGGEYDQNSPAFGEDVGENGQPPEIEATRPENGAAVSNGQRPGPSRRNGTGANQGRLVPALQRRRTGTGMRKPDMNALAREFLATMPA